METDLPSTDSSMTIIRNTFSKTPCPRPSPPQLKNLKASTLPRLHPTLDPLSPPLLFPLCVSPPSFLYLFSGALPGHSSWTCCATYLFVMGRYMRATRAREMMRYHWQREVTDAYMKRQSCIPGVRQGQRARAVKGIDSKSIGLSPREFESRRCRFGLHATLPYVSALNC